MPHDVFISYSSLDKPTAEAVCHALEAEGVRCWVAHRDARPGRLYQGSIVRAIRDARAMVLVFSDGANASAHVTREVAIASDANKPVVPFRVEEAEMSDELYYYISSVHWLDAITPPLEQHIERLVRAVKRLLSGTIEAETSGGRRPVGKPIEKTPTQQNGLRSSSYRRAIGLGALVVLAAATGVWIWGTPPTEGDSIEAAGGSEGRGGGLVEVDIMIDCATSLEVGDTATFVAFANEDASLPLTYTWDWGDGTTSDGLVATHSWPSLGTYTVTFTATGPVNYDSATCLVTVNEEGQVSRTVRRQGYSVVQRDRSECEGGGGQISGQVVTGSDYGSLPGANVLIEGTNRGTVTDIEGRFALNDTPVGDCALRISFVGYPTLIAELEITEQERFEIFEVSVGSGREVVVVSYD